MRLRGPCVVSEWLNVSNVGLRMNLGAHGDSHAVSGASAAMIKVLESRNRILNGGSLSSQPKAVSPRHVLLVPQAHISHVFFLRLAVLHQGYIVRCPRLAALIMSKRRIADKDHEACGEHAKKDDNASWDGHAVFEDYPGPERRWQYCARCAREDKMPECRAA